jgi:hypothetical protein
MSCPLNTINSLLLRTISSLCIHDELEKPSCQPTVQANASRLNHKTTGNFDQPRPRNDGLDLHRAQ